mmetsp:Transcript_29258/g.51367  ORF Transcript_29258/g.51367 Transcript_29258/m.51367 type:complete len:161 (+) Transcript_29258:102-584(+)
MKKDTAYLLQIDKELTKSKGVSVMHIWGEKKLPDPADDSGWLKHLGKWARETSSDVRLNRFQKEIMKKGIAKVQTDVASFLNEKIKAIEEFLMEKTAAVKMEQKGIVEIQTGIKTMKNNADTWATKMKNTVNGFVKSILLALQKLLDSTSFVTLGNRLLC